MKKTLRKFTPNFIISIYHLFYAWLGSVVYGSPSKKIKVIGVTGTKGKSSVVYMAGRILEETGQKVGWVSSLSIKVAEKEALNPLHLTMPGKMFIQKSLAAMVNAGCQYALIEVTSEGILQHRHRFIEFNTVVLTNLAEEHLEAHGGFENYKKAKGKLFKALKGRGEIIVNLDDPQALYFLDFEAKDKYGFGLTLNHEAPLIIQGKNYQASSKGISFVVNDVEFNLSLLGEFNIYNALAAITVAFSQGFTVDVAQKALEKITKIEGRMEEIKQGQSYKVYVDLAHTPDSFRQVFELVDSLPHHKIITVFGSAGGGRDKWKRPKLASIAAEFSDWIILTNEDPYDEDPQQIISDISKGLEQFKKYEIIPDRRKAIAKAINKAEDQDIVLVLGKGTEATLVIGDQEIPWDDRQVVKEEIERKI